MSTLPLVSVALPCFNHQHYVAEAIQSVLEQDYPLIELIIIDDGSSDSSAEQILAWREQCQKRCVRFEFRQRDNKGVSATLNEALAWCQGTYFSPLATDDRMLPNKISSQVKLWQQLEAEQPGRLKALFGGLEIINTTGEIKKRICPAPSTCTQKQVLLKQAYLPAPTVLLKTEEVKKVGGYPAKALLEDLALWLKLLETPGYFYCSNSPVSQYRRHPNNTSAKVDYMLKGIEQALQPYQSHPGYQRALARQKLVQYLKRFKNKPVETVFRLLACFLRDPSMLIDTSLHRCLVQQYQFRQ